MPRAHARPCYGRGVVSDRPIEGRWRRPRPAHLAALALCLPLVVPAVAPAATAQVADGRLLVTAGEDERNVVRLSGAGRATGFRFTVEDTGAPVLFAGPGCASSSLKSVTCDAVGFRVLTGNGDDSFVFSGVPGRSAPGRIDAGPGRDGVATTAAAIDTSGGPGDDVLFSAPPAGDGRDGTLRGGSGNDRLVGRSDAGRAGPSVEQQKLFGGPGNDRLTGGDELFGGSGDDRLDGLAGGDRLRGERGNDSLTGSGGRDRFSGGGGLDRIDSARGDRGGFSEQVSCGSGIDRVTPNGVDRLRRSCNLVDDSDERLTAFPRPKRGGSLAFRLRCKLDRGCAGSIRLRRPGRRTSYARARYRLGVGDSRTIRVRLGRAARRALARRGGVRTRVTTGALAYTAVLKR